MYRLAQVSVDIIDQCVAQGVPFAREYGGLLDNRSFGGAQVSRTFYARGQTGQQLLLGAYQALMRAGALDGTCTLYPRTEMLDVVVKDGRTAGIVVPRPEDRRGVLDVGATRSCSRPAATATPSICRPTRRTRTSPPRGAPPSKGAYFANPCYTQIHPTCIPASDEFQIEAHPDVGVVAQRRPHLGAQADRRLRARADKIPESRPRLLPRAPVPVVRQSRAARRRVARDQARGRRGSRRRPAEERCVPRLRRRDRAGSATTSIEAALRQPLRDVRTHHRRGSLQLPMRIYPAVHYTMGGLWVDYNLMSNLPGLVRARRSELRRPRRQPARRVGAHAGPRRRLLRAALHDRRLPRAAARTKPWCPSTTPRS